jgi:membrane-associated phospholipid phosphatase
VRPAVERDRLRLGVLAAAGVVVAGLALPLAVLVRDGWGPIQRFDQRASTGLTLAHGPARAVVIALTQLGAPLLLELAAVVLAVLLRARRRRALFVLVSVFGAELVSVLAKHVVARARPCVETMAAGCPGSTSFPSGHALGAGAFWTTVAVLLLPRLGRRVWLLAALVPLLVAATRVLLGVHYPSDVVAGLLVGWSWAAASTAVLAAWRDERTGRAAPLAGGVG